MRAYLSVTLLLIVIFGGIGGYLYHRFSAFAAADYSPPPVTVAAAPATSETWASTLDAVGTIKSAHGVQLSTEASGKITRIPVVSGARVAAGELILRLDDRVQVASQERQQSQLELARLLHRRDAQLVGQKSIPQSQYDRSQADLSSATAQVAETEAILDIMRLEAPFDGTLGIIQVRVGDYVQAGTRIASLQDLTNLEVDFTVPAQHYPRLQQGMAIAVSVAAFPDREFKATLQAVDAQVDAGTRNLLLRASIEAGAGLLPGMFARLRLDLADPQQLVTVPETAVSYSTFGDTVYVVQQRDSQLLVTPQIVRTGQSRDGRIAILDGIAAGTEVVTAGQNKLYRGAEITIDATVSL